MPTARLIARDSGYTVGNRPGHPSWAATKETNMAALIALVLILAIFGGLGFAVHLLWIVLVIAVLLWLIGFFVGGIPDGGRRRWYGR
jgi:fatty acid desaturase